MMVVLGYFGGELGLFASTVNNFMTFPHPTALRLVLQIRIQMFIAICHGDIIA
jgi:hypothetical protein